jgi:hypothetical protein
LSFPKSVASSTLKEGECDPENASDRKIDRKRCREGGRERERGRQGEGDRQKR